MAAPLHCLARLVRLGESSCQPSITCKMRKKSSGSITSLCAGLVRICAFFGNLWRFEYICGGLECICEGFFMNLWRFVVVFCVIVEVLCIIVEVLCLFCEFVKFCGIF